MSSQINGSNQNLRYVVRSILASVVLFITLSTSVGRAEAAWGNVQFAVRSNDVITRMQVSGRNQNRTSTTWGPVNTQSNYVITKDWWWNNIYTINFKVRFSNGRSYDCDVALPQHFWSNVEETYIDAWTGTGWISLAPSPRCTRIYNF